jgi:acyl-CoA thioester hydrolase
MTILPTAVAAAEIYRHPVAYADTDAGGIVYHGRYLEIAERARNQMIYRLGLSYSQLIQRWRIMFVVRNVEMKFEAPAMLDDIIEVTTSLVRCDPSRTVWLTEFSLPRGRIATVRLELVAVDVDDRGIRPHPAPLLDALRCYQAG